MKRRLAQLLLAAALLLAAGALALAARAPWVRHELRLQRRWTEPADGRRFDEEFRLATDGGQVYAYWTRYDVDSTVALFDDAALPRPGWRVLHTTARDPPRPIIFAYQGRTAFERLGFRHVFGGGVGGEYELGLFAPSWFAVLLPLALAALPWRHLRRAARRPRRIADGACAACGYDLRGAAHDRCPECGMGVSAAAV